MTEGRRRQIAVRRKEDHKLAERARGRCLPVNTVTYCNVVHPNLCDVRQRPDIVIFYMTSVRIVSAWSLSFAFSCPSPSARTPRPSLSYGLGNMRVL